MSDHEELESSVAPLVLGALEPEEAEAVRMHVDGCATCREIAARLRRVTAVIPLAVDEVAPPPRLRERVLAAAAAGLSRDVAPIAVRRSRAPRARSWRIRFGGERVPVYAAAAAAVVALVAGLLVGDVVGHAPAPPASQVARFTLSGHQEMSGSQAAVIDLKSDGVVLVDFRGLPLLQPGRVYELWLIPAGGSPEAAAVFVPDSNGAKVVLVSRSIAGYSEMAVTNEPGPDGSVAPTQQPELYGKLA